MDFILWVVGIFAVAGWALVGFVAHTKKGQAMPIGSFMLGAFVTLLSSVWMLLAVMHWLTSPFN